MIGTPALITQISQCILQFLIIISPAILVYIIQKVAQRMGYVAYPYLLFIGSYLPLYPILVWKTVNQRYIIEGVILPNLTFFGLDWSIFGIISANLLVISIIYQGMIIILARYQAGQIEEISVLNDITPVANEYVLVYIYPLLLLNYSKLFDIVVFLVVFASIAIIQVRTERYMVNPVLVFFGYYFYQVESEDGNVFLLSRQKFDEGVSEEITQIKISNNVRAHTGSQ